MKKKGLMLLLCIPFALGAFGMTACGDTCEHTFENSWQSNATTHWKNATCEHTDVKGEIGGHVDTNDDGVCETCGYGADHEHEFESTWTINATHHWKAATCSHSVKGEEAAHVDENDDGRCDVCLFDNGHVCEYETEYEMDEDGHWLPTVDCDHAPANDEAHADEDNDHYCDVCGYDMDDVDVEAVVEAATAADKAALVNGGTVYYFVPDEIDDGVMLSNTYSYTFGANHTYFKDESNYKYENWDGSIVAYSMSTEKWTEDNDGSLFQVIKEDYDATAEAMDYQDSLRTNEYPNESDIIGVSFNASFLSSADLAGGVEDLVYKVYAYANANTNGNIYNYADGYNANGGYYYISYAEYSSDYYSYAVSVNFDLDEETGVITSANVIADAYWGTMVYVEELDKVFYTEAGASATYTYEISQTVGERTATNEYSADSIAIDSFEIKFGDQTYENGDTINVTAGATWSFEPYSTDEKISLNSFTFTFDGEEMWAFGNKLNIYANAQTVGTHTLSVTNGVATVEVTVVAGYAETTAIYARSEDSNDSDLNITTATVYTDVEFTFYGKVNAGAESVHTASVTSANADTATLTKAESGNGYTFKATVAGEYVVTLSAKDGAVTATLTITVTTPPTPAELLNGKYKANRYYGNNDLTLEFTPASTGATTGTVAVVVSGGAMNWATFEFESYEYSGSYTYAYNADTKAVDLTAVAGNEITGNLSIEIVDYQLVVVYDNDNLQVEAVVEQEGVSLEGQTYKVNLQTGETTFVDVYMIFEADGIVLFKDHPSLNNYELVCEYSTYDFYGNTMINLTYNEDISFAPMNNPITWDWTRPASIAEDGINVAYTGAMGNTSYALFELQA